MEMDKKKKIALLSNVTVDLIAGKLRKEYEFYLPEGFDTWVQEVFSSTSGLYTEGVDAVVVLLDGTEARSWKNELQGAERIGAWKQAMTILAEKFENIPIFVSTIDVRESKIKTLTEHKMRYEMENAWYQYVQEMIDRKENIYLWDVVELIMELGRKQFYSNKMWYVSNMPYSREGLNAVSAELDRILRTFFGERKKAIVVDLDNTMWGGVVGEDGIDGIELSHHKEGQRYFDFQKQMLEMKNRGIVFAINSKNNVEDAEKAIQNHPAMAFRLEDFVSRKINWNSKAQNIKEIVQELNISESGFMFIDDNPVEREIVRGECKGVEVPEFPEDTTELITFAENIWNEYCRPPRVLEEDRKKTLMYQNEAKRKQEMGGCLNLEDYIAKLEMIVDIHPMRRDELDRVVQLINKTNQFNLTTKRYTKEEIQEIVNKDTNKIYVAYSSDKYGEQGLISVVILCEEDRSVIIDSFLMSCRVMGRKLEDVIINAILEKYKEKEAVIGEFRQTEKNGPVKDLYERLGFIMIEEREDKKRYEFKMSNYKKREFEFYKKVDMKE